MQKRAEFNHYKGRKNFFLQIFSVFAHHSTRALTGRSWLILRAEAQRSLYDLEIYINKENYFESAER
tara:strand:+ start:158 stop:358 length:201 start_codon:yes stop_codon:yes gene_type:complete